MSSPKTLKLASFNIRFGRPQLEDPTNAWNKINPNLDCERPWCERREGLVDQVIWEEPDIIGFQEVRLILQALAVSSSFPAGTQEST
jgi:hypothetical protein